MVKDEQRRFAKIGRCEVPKYLGGPQKRCWGYWEKLVMLRLKHVHVAQKLLRILGYRSLKLLKKPQVCSFHRNITLADELNNYNCRIWSCPCNCLVRFNIRRDHWTLAWASVTVNGLRYQEVINFFWWPELIWTTWAFNQTALGVAQAMKPSIF